MTISNDRSSPASALSPAARRFRLAPIGIIARYALLEALRMRLAWVFLAALGGVWALSYFAQALAIADAERLQWSFFAAGARVVCVFMLTMFVLVSALREFHDKGLELVLSLDLPRSHYVLGKLCGFLALAWLAALPATAVLAGYAPALAVAQWGLSLGLELSLMAALALFCIITFNQLIPAAGVVFGFYLLARTISAIQLISVPPATTEPTVIQPLVAMAVDLVALLIPPLDQYTQTAWLVDHAAAWSTLAAQAGQAGLYVLLLAAAAMFDFYRRNL
ncbi:MAG: ABC transporter permease [Burkholderiales bacterium]